MISAKIVITNFREKYENCRLCSSFKFKCGKTITKKYWELSNFAILWKHLRFKITPAKNIIQKFEYTKKLHIKVHKNSQLKPNDCVRKGNVGGSWLKIILFLFYDFWRAPRNFNPQIKRLQFAEITKIIIDDT